MASAPAFTFKERRNELRLKPRAGQPPATREHYITSVEHAKISRKEHLQGWNISHAQYEEAEFFAEKWMREHGAHKLDFGNKENHAIRGELMDALEDEFPFFMSRTILRDWRDVALKSFISTVRSEFRIRPALAEPTAPRKRARYEDYGEDPAKKSKTPQPAKKSLLAFSKIIVAHDDNDPHKHVVYLRDVIRNGAAILNADFNLNIRYIFPILIYHAFADLIVHSLSASFCVSWNTQTSSTLRTKETFSRPRSVGVTRELLMTECSSATHLRMACQQMGCTTSTSPTAPKMTTMVVLSTRETTKAAQAPVLQGYGIHCTFKQIGSSPMCVNTIAISSSLQTVQTSPLHHQSAKQSALPRVSV
jgi:hypothetical protein